MSSNTDPASGANTNFTIASTASTIQSYAEKGISYLQKQTFGITNDSKDASEQTKSSTAHDEKIDKAGKEQIEKFFREGTKSEPPLDILKGKE